MSSSPLSLRAPLAVLRAFDSHRQGVLRVLVYHRVRDLASGFHGDSHVLSATPAGFDEQMQYIARHYAPITAHQAVAALLGEMRLPRRAILVTFDDGYCDFLSEAWPILKRHGVPALLFIPTAFPGTARAFWWDELYEMVEGTDVPEARVFGLSAFPLRTAQDRWVAVRGLNRFLKHLGPGDLSARLEELRAVLGTPRLAERSVLSWDELRAMVAEGLAVGSHTRTHLAMPYLTAEQIVDEVRSAHADLERELGQSAPLFSYPFGMADPRAVPTLRELGYVAAFISLLGRNVVGRRDPFLLYRHSVDVQQSFVRLAMSLTTTYIGVRESGRAAKARLQQGLLRLVPSR